MQGSLAKPMHGFLLDLTRGFAEECTRGFGGKAMSYAKARATWG